MFTKFNLRKKRITNKNIIISLFISSMSLIILLTYIYMSTHKYKYSIFFSILLFISISTFLILKKKLILFEPIVIFSFYYFTVCISIWYLIYTDFKTNIFINNTVFNENINTLLNYTTFLFFIGYIFFLIGYYVVVNQELIFNIKFENHKLMSDSILNIMIFIFLFIGVLNFIYNVWYFADGNLLVYMKNISMRPYEFAKHGTTLGYIFAYNGMFIWLFKLVRNSKKLNLSFHIFFIITIIIRVSKGRIFQSIVYIITFIGIYYFVELNKKQKVCNFKYYISGIIIMIFGIFVYFMRRISSLIYNNKLNNSIMNNLEKFISDFGYFAVDKGNIPNIGIVLKIIDSWEKDIGFLHGKSFFNWIYNILPSQIRPDNYQLANIIKETWYSNMPGGLPPTGIGEMYANFGILGPTIGMLLFGFFAGTFYNILKKTKNFWFLIIYIQITVGFIALFPKGEIANFSLWSIIPIVFIYIFSIFISNVFN